MLLHPCSRAPSLALLCTAAVLLCAAMSALAETPVFATEVRPLLSKYCFQCHGEGKGKPKGKVDLAAFKAETEFPAHRKLWKQAREALDGHEMPPDDEAQPTEAERARIVAWIDAMRLRPRADGLPDPGQPVVRRLTRTEYSNTILDLLPTLRSPGRPPYFDPAKGFPADGVWLGLHAEMERYRVPIVELPPDDADHGFEGIGESMTLYPLLMNKYLAAATEVLDKAVAKRDPKFFVARVDPKKAAHEAAREIIESFAARAFRRPVSAEEVARFLKLYDLAESRGEPFESALKTPLQAVLISPHFLFRIERESAPAGVTTSGGVRPVGDFELATRLSYFLWSTMPDDTLIALARDGKLHDGATLDEQIRRMLQSPKSKALADNFSVQWLQLGGWESAMPDPQLFPIFYEDSYGGLRYTMRNEAVMFTEVMQLEDRSILEFLDADWGILNGGLAQFYGVQNWDGRVFNFGKEVLRKEVETWRKYQLPDRRRGGVLTMAGVLTSTSPPTRTSAVKRGEWVLKTILGQTLPPPPPNAGSLKDEEADPTVAGLTFRQRLDRHRSDPACNACHRRIDPLGFALENYDALGRWREKEGPLPPRDGEQTWDFNAVADFEGWSAGYQGGELQVKNGTLRGVGPNMTYIFSPRTHKRAAFDKVTVRLKNDTDSATLRLAFNTDADKAWDNAVNAPWKSLTTIAIQPHSDFAEYTFDMSKVPSWSGMITGVKLELEHVPGEWQIDWIKIHGTPGGPPPPAAIDATAMFPNGQKFHGPEELKTILATTRRDEFVRAYAAHLLTYAIGRHLREEDAPAVEKIAKAAAANGYRYSAVVTAVIKSDPFLYRLSNDSAPTPSDD
jgi:hypothetical protein